MNMKNNRKELEAKVAAAKSPEEIENILKAAGETISPEDAAELFEKVQARKTDKALSLDELEAVSDGADRDWLVDGCAATVEDGSHCRSNDKCIIGSVIYEHPPVSVCRRCGGVVYRASSEWSFIEELRCVNCGPNLELY